MPSITKPLFLAFIAVGLFANASAQKVANYAFGQISPILSRQQVHNRCHLSFTRRFINTILLCK